MLWCTLGKDCRLHWAWDRIKLGEINFIADTRGDCSQSKVNWVVLAELLFRWLSVCLCPKVTLLLCLWLLTTFSVLYISLYHLGRGWAQGCPLLLCLQERTASCGLAVCGDRQPTHLYCSAVHCTCREATELLHGVCRCGDIPFLPSFRLAMNHRNGMTIDNMLYYLWKTFRFYEYI